MKKLLKGVEGVFLSLKTTILWVGKTIAYAYVVGFVAVLFTYWGVNHLLSGLHSYAS